MKNNLIAIIAISATQSVLASEKTDSPNIGFIDKYNTQSVQVVNLTPNIKPKGIFERHSFSKSKEEKLGLNLVEAQRIFQKFDLKNKYSRASLLAFKDACKNSTPNFAENDKKLSRSIYISGSKNDWESANRFNDCIKNNLSGIQARYRNIMVEKTAIGSNYYSWPSIAKNTALTFSFLGGCAVVNQFLPTSFQINIDTWKLIVGIGAMTSLNTARMFGMKEYQDYKFRDLSLEAADLLNASVPVNTLSEYIDPFCE